MSFALVMRYPTSFVPGGTRTRDPLLKRRKGARAPATVVVLIPRLPFGGLSGKWGGMVANCALVFALVCCDGR